MKKIGIVTWFDSYNYGTCLQCYALNQYLNSQGYDSYVIEHNRYYYGINHPIETIKRIIDILNKKMRSTNQEIQLSAELIEKSKIRKNKNHLFAYSENNIATIHSKKDYQKIISSTDCFISGSDQIWNPEYVTAPMLLSLANENQKKIAYASSLGVSEIPHNMDNFYKKYLQRFDYIGVREETANMLIKKLVKKNVETVQDPTFLLDLNFWKKFSNSHMEMVPCKKYIFCYFIGNNTAWQDDVKKCAETMGMKAVIALSESNIVPDFGEIVSDAGVADFVALIENADYVVTDSFHACALSINMNKQFLVYKRFKENDVKSQNSRIEDLLKEYGLEGRVIIPTNSIEKCLTQIIDFTQVNEKLKKNRIKSRRFLIHAIEG